MSQPNPTNHTRPTFPIGPNTSLDLQHNDQWNFNLTNFPLTGISKTDPYKPCKWDQTQDINGMKLHSPGCSSADIISGTVQNIGYIGATLNRHEYKKVVETVVCPLPGAPQFLPNLASDYAQMATRYPASQHYSTNANNILQICQDKWKSHPQ
jgi:hypothetical protein